MYVNLEGLINRVGIERVGFVTLTFPDNCSDRDEASARFNSFSTGFLRRHYNELEFITVPERQRRGAFHFHLACAFPYDIRTGFDFDACSRAVAAKRDGDTVGFRRNERLYLRSANAALRGVWRDIRTAAPGYKFGRCETLPVLSNAQGIARYLGAYVTSESRNRLACDKGLRTVRYSLFERTASIRWSWADGNGRNWRRGLQLVGMILEMNYEQLSEKIGKKGWWKNRQIITTLGNSFDQAIQFVGRIPSWADFDSRLRFLSSLCSYLEHGVNTPDEYLLELELEKGQPF